MKLNGRLRNVTARMFDTVYSGALGCRSYPIAAFAICFASAPAFAGFVAISDLTPGATWPRSTASVNATYRNNGNGASLPSLPIPFVGSQSASIDGGASVVEAYSFSADALQLTQSTFDRGPGPSGVSSSGAWVFGVTESMTAVAGGRLTVTNSGYSNVIAFSVILDDLTAGMRLLSSNRLLQTATADLVLGDSVTDPSFSGALVNDFLPSHTYRMLYTFSVSNAEAAADSSVGVGRLSLSSVVASTVPIPSSLPLVALGLGGLILLQSRPRAK